jgi:hypothetical protein
VLATWHAATWLMQVFINFNKINDWNTFEVSMIELNKWGGAANWCLPSQPLSRI